MSETQLAVGPSHVSWEVRLNLRRNQLQMSGRGAFQVKEKSRGRPLGNGGGLFGAGCCHTFLELREVVHGRTGK